MEQTKETITTSLITIRGGLSVISKCTDTMRSIEERKIQLNDDVRRMQGEIDFLEYKLSSTIYKRDLNSDQLKNELSAPRFYGDTYKWFCLIGIIIILISFFVSLFMFDYHIVIMLCSIVIAIGVLISYPIYVKREFSRFIKKHIESQQEYSDNFRCKINEKRNELNQALKEQEKFEAKTKPIIKKNSAVAKSIAVSLQENYGMLLNESDWENVDLIIHYIVTGRADNIKEALYQVDRQRQTDQIVQAINEARKSLCVHIDSAFNKLGSALTESFSRLDRHIQEIGYNIRQASKLAQSQNEKLLEKIGKQIEETKVQNALIEKSNKTSDELLSDFRYSQRYWDNI